MRDSEKAQYESYDQLRSRAIEGDPLACTMMAALFTKEVPPEIIYQNIDKAKLRRDLSPDMGYALLLMRSSLADGRLLEALNDIQPAYYSDYRTWWTAGWEQAQNLDWKTAKNCLLGEALAYKDEIDEPSLYLLLVMLAAAPMPEDEPGRPFLRDFARGWLGWREPPARGLPEGQWLEKISGYTKEEILSGDAEEPSKYLEHLSGRYHRMHDYELAGFFGQPEGEEEAWECLAIKAIWVLCGLKDRGCLYMTEKFLQGRGTAKNAAAARFWASLDNGTESSWQLAQMELSEHSGDVGRWRAAHALEDAYPGKASFRLCLAVEALQGYLSPRAVKELTGKAYNPDSPPRQQWTEEQKIAAALTQLQKADNYPGSFHWLKDILWSLILTYQAGLLESYEEMLSLLREHGFTSLLSDEGMDTGNAKKLADILRTVWQKALAEDSAPLQSADCLYLRSFLAGVVPPEEYLKGRELLASVAALIREARARKPQALSLAGELCYRGILGTARKKAGTRLARMAAAASSSAGAAHARICLREATTRLLRQDQLLIRDGGKNDKRIGLCHLWHNITELGDEEEYLHYARECEQMRLCGNALDTYYWGWRRYVSSSLLLGMANMLLYRSDECGVDALAIRYLLEFLFFSEDEEQQVYEDYLLIWAYLSTDGAAREAEKARPLIEGLLAKNRPEGTLWQGICKLWGWGIPREENEGQKLCRAIIKAGQNESPLKGKEKPCSRQMCNLAAFHLGEYFRQLGKGNKAEKYYKISLEGLYGKAALRLGKLLAEGGIIKKDLDKAYWYMSTAGALGWSSGFLESARFAEKAAARKKDFYSFAYAAYNNAMPAYPDAALAGQARCYLAVDKAVEAFELLHILLEEENEPASFKESLTLLADCYEKGLGTPPDPQAAAAIRSKLHRKNTA